MRDFDGHAYARLWARQLLREFEAICWRHGLELPTPTVEIFASRSRLGEWREVSRTLRLSERLIMEHPWPVTINVFKHEMAHQLCGHWGQPEAGHGPLFHEACQRLGVPPAYRRASGDTPQLFVELETESALVAEGRRFFAKVEKLLALGRSANEHEAALAMRKANELIVKHNLGSLGAEAERRYRHAVLGGGKQRLHGWQRAIGGILRDFFFVTLVLADTYDPRRDLRLKTMDIFGRAENVAVAEYCYHFLERELGRLWQRRQEGGQRGGLSERHSYYLGVLAGFRQKLAAQQPPPPAGAPETMVSALVLAGDQGLRDFVGQVYPRLSSRRSRGSRVNPTTYDHGRADGGNIVLRAGVGESQGNCGRLLSGG